MPNSDDVDINSPVGLPPNGDSGQAEKYILQLIKLIDKDLITVSHTDLSRFDPSSLQFHYRINLKDYQVEISHSKHPDSGKDSYIMLFTNIKNMIENRCEKLILAYLHLEVAQFNRFKKTADDQLFRIKKAEEEKRLKEALAPVDKVLDQISNIEAVIPSQKD
ncbi:hypothetical protein HYW42_01780 [Candidatus Daviesbacteria bacterium]|nr:hypothetical protein [Candidatus Daviesbacteria bacterium]